MAKNVVEWVRRAAAKYWFGADVSSLELPPIVLNNEYLTSINAAGSSTVNLIKGNASDVPELGNGAVIATPGTGSTAIVTVGGAQTLTSKTLTTPTIAQINDTGGINRALFNATAKTIVDGSATSLFDVACAAGERIAGIIFYQVQASDGTDHQSMCGMVSYAAVSKAGTHTLAITNAAANDAKAVSSGTLTLSWTHVTGSGKTTVKLQPSGSLTETTYTVTYTVLPISGVVTIL